MKDYNSPSLYILGAALALAHNSITEQTMIKKKGLAKSKSEDKVKTNVPTLNQKPLNGKIMR